MLLSYTPQADDIMMMSNAAQNRGAFGLHFGAFCTTIASQGTPEQVMEWLIPAYQMKITGCLGQTEVGGTYTQLAPSFSARILSIVATACLIRHAALPCLPFGPCPSLSFAAPWQLGHGSNVRGLQTVARYDQATQEFVLSTPSLQAMKWWPGGLGKMATHCAMYANLLLDGEEKGFHVFMVRPKKKTVVLRYGTGAARCVKGLWCLAVSCRALTWGGRGQCLVAAGGVRAARAVLPLLASPADVADAANAAARFAVLLCSGLLFACPALLPTPSSLGHG